MAFTEQGVAMLSGVLRSKNAVNVNIMIMRTFVELRQFILSNQDLVRKLEKLEEHYDAQFRVVFEAIRALVKQNDEPKRLIGFHGGSLKK